MYNTITEKISFLEYNFFKYEDRSDKNIYSLKKLKAETRKMEKTKAFKNLIKKIKNVIIIIIIKNVINNKKKKKKLFKNYYLFYSRTPPSIKNEKKKRSG